jgi:hypothetical protein
MKTVLALFAACTITITSLAQAAETDATNSASALDPWVGKYPMSLFTKTRSSKTVGKGHLSVSWKFQHFDWSRVRGSDNDYHERTSGQTKSQVANTLCFKYGWAEDHHIALGIPYFINDYDLPGASGNDSQGIGNIFLFEKWNIIKETNTMPGVAIDYWLYLPSGDTNRKLGSDDWANKISLEVSKRWNKFSLHFNPNYKWNETKNGDVGEVNVGAIWHLCPELLPAIEYNYFDKESKGHRHDIVPGLIWKFRKGWSFKVGAPVNISSTFTDRDRVGIVAKLFYRF